MAFDVDIAKQYFDSIPESVIMDLIQEGDVMHCCGGFLIDSPLIQPYLKSREGTQDSIMGLPIHLLRNLLNKVEF